MLKLDIIFLVLMLLILLFVAERADAETKLVINITSYHTYSPDFKSKKQGIEEYNKRNFGAGIEYHPSGSNKYFGTGFYENSFYEKSCYVTAGVKAEKQNGIYVSAEISIADGYELSSRARGRYLIVPALALHIAPGKIDSHVTKIMFISGGVWGLQYNYALK